MQPNYCGHLPIAHIDFFWPFKTPLVQVLSCMCVIGGVIGRRTDTWSQITEADKHLVISSCISIREVHSYDIYHNNNMHPEDSVEIVYSVAYFE